MNWHSDHCTAWLLEAGPRAKAAATRLAVAPDAQRNAALHAAARSLRDAAADIIAANEADIAACASRVITVRDGVIKSDTRRPARDAAADLAALPAPEA